MIMIVILPLLTNNISQQLSIKGNLLIFMAMLAFTAYGIMSKKQSEAIGASPVALTFYFSLFGLLFSLPLAINELNSGLIVWNRIFFLHWLSAVAAGITGTTLFYLVYQNAIKAGGQRPHRCLPTYSRSWEFYCRLFYWEKQLLCHLLLAPFWQFLEFN